MQHGPWRKRVNLASGLSAAERFLAAAGFARAPWLVAAFGGGIGAWFALPTATWWVGLMLACAAALGAAIWLIPRDGALPHLRQAIAALAVALALGCGHVWINWWGDFYGCPSVGRYECVCYCHLACV